MTSETILLETLKEVKRIRELLEVSLIAGDSMPKINLKIDGNELYATIRKETGAGMNAGAIEVHEYGKPMKIISEEVGQVGFESEQTVELP